MHSLGICICIKSPPVNKSSPLNNCPTVPQPIGTLAPVNMGQGVHPQRWNFQPQQNWHPPQNVSTSYMNPPQPLMAIHGH